MRSERVQRQIDWLLNAAEAAVRAGNWHLVRDHADAVLTFEPDNVDAQAFLQAAARQLAGPPKSQQTAAAALSSPDAHRGDRDAGGASSAAVRESGLADD